MALDDAARIPINAPGSGTFSCQLRSALAAVRLAPLDNGESPRSPNCSRSSSGRTWPRFCQPTGAFDHGFMSCMSHLRLVGTAEAPF